MPDLECLLDELQNWGKKFAKHDSMWNDVQRLQDDVERHEAAIALLQRSSQVHEAPQALVACHEIWQMRLREELVASQLQLVSELRAELHGHLQSHAVAIK